MASTSRSIWKKVSGRAFVGIDPARCILGRTKGPLEELRLLQKTIITTIEGVFYGLLVFTFNFIVDCN